MYVSRRKGVETPLVTLSVPSTFDEFLETPTQKHGFRFEIIVGVNTWPFSISRKLLRTTSFCNGDSELEGDCDLL